MAKDFAFDDLVWAKMKGFPPWPARISQPPDNSSSKSKKPQHFVYFFGTHDVAWILDELIFPHSEEMLANSNNYKKKSSALQLAIDEIKEESLKAAPKPKKVVKEKDKEVPQIKSPESISTPGTSKTGKETPDSPRLDDTPGTSKTPKKTPLKKKTKKIRAKKQRSPSPDKDIDSSSLKVEDYSLLVANVPPNNALANVAVIPPYEGQVALATSFDRISSAADASAKPKPKKTLPPNNKRFGFIGLGAMGSRMVRNLLNSKHNVTVWDRTAEKCDAFVKLGATKADTAADLVRFCDIIFSCLPNAEAVKQVFFSKDGVQEGFQGGGSSRDRKGYVEMTSVDPTTSQDVSEQVCGEGARYLEAPMVGSRQNLEDGAIGIVAAGDRSLFTECDTCFNAWARHAYYVSCDVGSASKMSLILSMISGITFAAVAETLSLVETSDIDPGLFMNAVEDSSMSCPLVMNMGHAMLQKDAVVDLPLKHLQNDLDMAVALSNNCDQPLVVTTATNEMFKRAGREYAEEDVSAVIKSYKYD